MSPRIYDNDWEESDAIEDFYTAYRMLEYEKVFYTPEMIELSQDLDIKDVPFPTSEAALNHFNELADDVGLDEHIHYRESMLAGVIKESYARVSDTLQRLYPSVMGETELLADLMGWEIDEDIHVNVKRVLQIFNERRIEMEEEIEIMKDARNAWLEPFCCDCQCTDAAETDNAKEDANNNDDDDDDA